MKNIITHNILVFAIAVALVLPVLVVAGCNRDEADSGALPQQTGSMDNEGFQNGSEGSSEDDPSGNGSSASGGDTDGSDTEDDDGSQQGGGSGVEDTDPGTEPDDNGVATLRELSPDERDTLRNLQTGQEFTLLMPEGHLLYLRVDRRSVIMPGITSLSGSFRSRNEGNWNLSQDNDTISGSINDYVRNKLYYMRTNRETGVWFIENIDLMQQNMLPGGEPLEQNL
jgi:hypothetical protein